MIEITFYDRINYKDANSLLKKINNLLTEKQRQKLLLMPLSKINWNRSHENKEC